MSDGSITGEGLRSIATRGWRRGFRPLLRKEIGQWWATRQWLVQALVWLVLINGVIGLLMIMDPSENALQAFLQVGMLVTAIGVVVTVQGAVVGERHRGTAAWVLSKPVSRPAFLLAKLVAYAIGFGVVAILLPWALFNLEARLILGAVPDAGRFAGAVGLWGLHLLVYIALVLALGTVFRSRGPVAAVGIGVLLAGQFFGGMFPLSVTTLLPWILPELATALALGRELPTSLPAALIPNLAVVVGVTAVALWRLGREEL